MIVGIGIDMVQISDLKYLLENTESSFAKRTFTEQELLQAQNSKNKEEYLATRFAAKEAVFKALAHILPSKSFDFRIVETLNTHDGCPYIHTQNELLTVMKATHTDKLHISLTTEDDFATAFVIAESIE